VTFVPEQGAKCCHLLSWFCKAFCSFGSILTKRNDKFMPLRHRLKFLISEKRLNLVSGYHRIRVPEESPLPTDFCSLIATIERSISVRQAAKSTHSKGQPVSSNFTDCNRINRSDYWHPLTAATTAKTLMALAKTSLSTSPRSWSAIPVR
jgi:hypothetical protein